MRESGGRRRVSEVVGRHVNGLHRSDRAAFGRSDTLLHLAHLLGQSRLITHGGRYASEERRHLLSRLSEAENVVHEEEYVFAVTLITQGLGHGETRESHASASARHFVHLSEHERGLIQNAGVLHFVIQVVTLAHALADTGEDRVTAVLSGDVVDQLLNEHGLTDTGAAEETDLSALNERSEEVHRLDTGLEDFRSGRLLGKGRGFLMNGALLRTRDRLLTIKSLTEHIEQAAERDLSHRYRDRLTSVGDGQPAREALRILHRDGAHSVETHVLGHFERHGFLVFLLHLKSV